jgi:hypothetical protein
MPSTSSSIIPLNSHSRAGSQPGPRVIFSSLVACALSTCVGGWTGRYKWLAEWADACDGLLLFLFLFFLLSHFGRVHRPVVVDICFPVSNRMCFVLFLSCVVFGYLFFLWRFQQYFVFLIFTMPPQPHTLPSTQCALSPPWVGFREKKKSIACFFIRQCGLHKRRAGRIFITYLSCIMVSSSSSCKGGQSGSIFRA